MDGSMREGSREPIDMVATIPPGSFDPFYMDGSMREGSRKPIDMVASMAKGCREY
jgi:hypothetical protein